MAKVRLSLPAVDDLDRMIKGGNRWPPSQPRPAQELEDAEDIAAMLEWKARDAAAQTTFVPADEARRRLGLPR